MATLIAELSASFNEPSTAISSNIFQQKIAPLLTADLQQTIAEPVAVPAPIASPFVPGSNKINITSAFSADNVLVKESPVV
ncbi:MAG: hypothetical protein Q8903_03530, partial [Bacteroidota bacterium]|nr:hypothetical protein [Bacteroidota bacterium]